MQFGSSKSQSHWIIWAPVQAFCEPPVIFVLPSNITLSSTQLGLLVEVKPAWGEACTVISYSAIPTQLKTDIQVNLIFHTPAVGKVWIKSIS